MLGTAQRFGLIFHRLGSDPASLARSFVGNGAGNRYVVIPAKSF
jgi:hypothetical protein